MSTPTIFDAEPNVQNGIPVFGGGSSREPTAGDSDASRRFSLRAVITFTVTLALFTHWYIFVLKGYGTSSFGFTEATPPNGTRYNPLNAFLPQELSCPSNAVCENGTVVGCTSYHTLKVTFIQRLLPPFLLPFPLNQMACVVDRKKFAAHERSARITHWIEEQMDLVVRAYTGDIECGYKSIPKGSPVAGMPVDLARDAVIAAAKPNGLNRYKVGKDIVAKQELEDITDNFISALRDSERGERTALMLASDTLMTTSSPITNRRCRVRSLAEFVSLSLVTLAFDDHYRLGALVVALVLFHLY